MIIPVGSAGVDDAQVEDDGVPGLRGHPLGAPAQDVAVERERHGLPPKPGAASYLDEPRSSRAPRGGPQVAQLHSYPRGCTDRGVGTSLRVWFDQ